MRKLTIEITEGPCGFDVVTEDGKRCDGLAWDELIGQVVSLTHPKIGQPQYRMQTAEQWVAERKLAMQGLAHFDGSDPKQSD